MPRGALFADRLRGYADHTARKPLDRQIATHQPVGPRSPPCPRERRSVTRRVHRPRGLVNPKRQSRRRDWRAQINRERPQVRLDHQRAPGHRPSSAPVEPPLTRARRCGVRSMNTMEVRDHQHVRTRNSRQRVPQPRPRAGRVRSMTCDDEATVRAVPACSIRSATAMAAPSAPAPQRTGRGGAEASGRCAPDGHRAG